MKSPVAVFLAVLFGALALGSGGWGWQQYQRAQAAEFQQRRVALLERENERLRTIVAEQERTRQLAADTSRRQEIEKAVMEIRGLKFLRPVDYQVLQRSGFRSIVDRKLGEQFTDADFKSMSDSLAALGLVPRGFPLKQKYIDLLGEQVAAFYDQHTHKLYMFEGSNLENAQNRVILAHELTHALQDQHFGLDKLPLEIKDNDDRCAAAASLVEGEATLVMTEYMQRNLSVGTVTDTLASVFTQSMAELARAPRILREMLTFPYLQGQKFCLALFDRGGYPAISNAYKKPPGSTTHVMHPEKYFAGEEPQRPEWPDATVLGQKPAYDNVLGEAGTRILLGEWVDEERAPAIAGGWRGDRYLLYDGGNALVWKSLWKNEPEATEFAEAMKTYLEQRRQKEPKAVAFAEIKRPSPTEVVFLVAGNDEWLAALRAKFAKP